MARRPSSGVASSFSSAKENACRNKYILVMYGNDISYKHRLLKELLKGKQDVHGKHSMTSKAFIGLKELATSQSSIFY